MALYNKDMACVLRRVICWRLYIYTAMFARRLHGLYVDCVALFSVVGCVVYCCSIVALLVGCAYPCWLSLVVGM